MAARSLPCSSCAGAGTMWLTPRSRRLRWVCEIQTEGQSPRKTEKQAQTEKRKTLTEHAMIKRETEVRREGKRHTQRNKCGEIDPNSAARPEGDCISS